jgi:hypothetical protein
MEHRAVSQDNRRRRGRREMRILSRAVGESGGEWN